MREMGESEREIQRLLGTVSVHEEFVPPLPQPYFHNVDVPMVGSRGLMSNFRKAHNVPVCGVITKGAHTCDIVREEVDSADEESLAHISGGSGTEEMESVPLPKILSSTKFRRHCGRTRQVPLCWHAAQCPWHRRGRCLLKHQEAAKSLATGEEEIKAELNALWTALKKLTASLMWRTGSAFGANAAAISAAIFAACTERFPERTTEQIEDTSLPQASASQVTGSPRLDELDAAVCHRVRQEQFARGETTQKIVDVPTVQEQAIVQGIPEVQIVERIQEQIVESIPLERVQQRTVEQSVSLFERLDINGKRLDMSLSRRLENEEMIKEIGKLLEEKHAIDSTDVIATKVRWEPDPPDFGEQEELDQEELDYLQYEFGADEEYE